MSYIENVFICLAAPVLITAVSGRGQTRRLTLFLLCGMAASLLSSYISTFFAALCGANLSEASLTIAPIVEEVMKFCPFLFYLLVFQPKKERAAGCMLMLAVGFATFENVCYLTQNGAGSFWYLLIRGFGTGAMHVVCGAVLAFALRILWDRLWLRLIGTVGLVVVTITYHGVYNLLVSQTGALALIGYLIPLLTGALGLVLRKTVLARVD